MGRSSTVRWLLLAVVMFAALFAELRVAEGRVVRGGSGTTFEQCANLPKSTIVDCTGAAWTTGDLNAQNSLYSEGDFVPDRVQIGDLTAGTTYDLVIGYDAVVDGLHAYDYMGSYDASQAPGQQIVPCDGVAGTGGPHACGTGSVPGTPSTINVPIDGDTNFPPGRSQIPGVFSAWGGELQNAAYVPPTPTIDVSPSGTIERDIDITFVADGDTVVLAWGGHLASNLDWGAGNTFLGNHSGAPFHLLLTSINGHPIGNQELSIHADVVAPAPGLSTQANPSTVTIGDTVTDVATLSGTSGLPTGSVAFYVCGPAAAAPDCSTGGTPVVESSVIVSRLRAAHRPRPRHHRRGPRAVISNGVASVSFVPGKPGFYCFRAEYTPAAGAPYSPWSHTDQTHECFQATSTPTTLSVTKICDPTSVTGHFNLLIDGNVELADATCGDTTGPVKVTAGHHVVSEAAGTGTSLTDYTSTIGGDCAADGTVTVAAGQSAVCTITNALKPPAPAPATLIETKVCQPAGDPGHFDFYVDSTLVAHDLPCGGSTGPITEPAGTYTVSEQGGTETSLADYTQTIGGACAANGTITLAAGQSATCTITNVRTPTPPTTITVNKVCMPADDRGRFNLTIDGHPAGTGANVGCGGSTGTVTVQAGLHTVGETGAGGTDLADYTSIIGGDCAADGSVLVTKGDQATCTITNVRRAPVSHPFALLTVNKICVPASDGGLFNLSIGPQVQTNVPCGGSLGPLAVSVGTHQVAETAGTGTDLSDYASTIGGACAADGSITLAAGQSAICTITNNLKPPDPTATIVMKKVCVPATTKARFTLHLDGQLLPAMACGQSTGAMTVPTGLHVVGELRAGTNPADYETVIGGDCAATGRITLAANQHATCTVTNTRLRPPNPPQPPTVCNTLSTTPRALVVGQRSEIVALVTAGGKPVSAARVTLAGLGAFDRRYTTASGTARFPVTPATAGILRLATQRQFSCGSAGRARVAAIKKHTPAHKPKPPAVAHKPKPPAPTHKHKAPAVTHKPKPPAVTG